MVNTSISTFIIDLKYTPDKRVQILEFGRAFFESNISGFSKAVNARKNAIKDVIGPFYNSLGMPVYQFLNTRLMRDYVEPPEIKATILKFDRDIPLSDLKIARAQELAQARGLVIAEKTLDRDLGSYIPAEAQPSIILDDNDLLRFCMLDKAALACIIGSYAPGIFPPSQILIRNPDDNIDWPSFKPNGRAWRHGYVLKRPQGAVGQQVKVVPRLIFNVFRLNRAANQRLMQKDFLMVAQPLIYGHKAKLLPTGPLYDPTIRTVATAIHDHGKTSLHFHDVAYYKFPLLSAKFRPLPGALKSIFLQETRLVEDEVKHDIWHQLAEGLKPALHRVLSCNPNNILAEMLEDNNDISGIIALRLLADDENFNSQNPEDFMGLEKEIRKFVSRSKKYSAIGQSKFLKDVYGRRTEPLQAILSPEK